MPLVAGQCGFFVDKVAVLSIVVSPVVVIVDQTHTGSKSRLRHWRFSCGIAVKAPWQCKDTRKEDTGPNRNLHDVRDPLQVQDQYDTYEERM